MAGLMAWLKVDDQYLFHPKVIAAGLEGRALHMASMTYCAGQLTDGFVPATTLPILGAMAGIPDATEAAAKLVEVGLWDRADAEGGWFVHDYLEYNPTRETVTAKRAESRERMRNLRGLRSPDVRAHNEQTAEDVQRLPSPSPSPSPDPIPVVVEPPSNGDDPETIPDRAKLFRMIAKAGGTVNGHQSEQYALLLEEFDIETIALGFAEIKKQRKIPRHEYLRAILVGAKERGCKPGSWTPEKAEAPGKPYARDGPLRTILVEDTDGSIIELKQ